MTLQELLADIQQNILPSGIPNNIDAAKIRQAIGNVAGFFNPADGDAVFEGFIRHVIYEGQNLQAFESYFVTPRKSKTGEFALFYDPTFFRGIVLARQVGSGQAPAPAASGSFTLSAAPFDGTVKSQVLNIGALTNDLEYAIKFYRADGIITNPVVRYNGQEVAAASIDFSSGVVVMPFVKILGQDTITLEYDLFASGTANTLNYSVRALKAPAGELSGQYVYHVENGGIGDFIFDLIIEQPGNIPEATPTEFGLVKKSNSLTDSGPDKVLNLDALKTALAGKLSLGTNTLGIATYLFSEFQFDVQLPNARLDFNDGSLDLNFPNSGFQFFDGAFVAALTGKGFAVNTGDGLYYEDIVGPYKRIFQVPSGDGSTDFRFEFRNKSTNALIQSFVFNENGARYTAPYAGANALDIVTRAWIEAITGILSTLNTVDKSSLANAVNEVLAIAQSAGGGGGTPLGFYDFDASPGTLPTTGSGTAGAIRLGDRWLIGTAGTLDDTVNTPVQVEVGDVLIAKVNGASNLTGFVVTQRNINLADQATAEGGTNNVLVMTSQRTRQQFRSLISDALLSILQGTQESFTTALRARLLGSLVSTDNNLVGTTIYTFASEFFNVNNAASGTDLRIGTADGFYYEDTQGTHKRIIHIPHGINESEIRFEVRSLVDNSLLVALVIDENGVRREGSFSVSSPQDVLTRSVIESISVLKSESENFTTAEKNKVSQSVISNPTGVTGADQVTNIISLTQAEYDAIASPDASTLYVIT